MLCYNDGSSTIKVTIFKVLLKVTTGEVISNSFLTIGMDTLTGGKRGFFNFTANLLQNKIAYALPKELLGIEILENVEPNQDIILA